MAATLGVLSGGCLEEEIGRHGRDVIRDGSPLLLSFDTRRLYGCDGLLKILVEPLAPAGENGNLITHIGRSLETARFAVSALALKATKLGSELLGADVFLTERAAFSSKHCSFRFGCYCSEPGPRSSPLHNSRKLLVGRSNGLATRPNSRKISGAIPKPPR